MRLPRSLSIAIAAFATTVAGVTIAPSADANPAGTGLVISEVYGAGGNTGAVYTNDFIELYNPTSADISVVGWSVQYRSAAGTSAQVTSLAGTVPAHGHYLVQEAAGTGGTTALPTPDALGSIPMAGSAGQVFLVNNTTAVSSGLTGNVAGSAAVVDMVGYGATVATFETVQTGVNLTSTTAATRDAAGTDTDHNANDFSELAPDPQNAGSAPPPPPPSTKTIAEIQGTGSVTPFSGQTVTTTGIVTAVYPTGGLSGFFLQTDGTGSGADATPGASDGLFVFLGGSTPAASYPSLGDLVQVTGVISEFNNLTEITATASNVVNKNADPHTGVAPLVAAYPTTEADREAHEGELLAPTDDFVVSNNFTTNQFAEIGLATGGRQLWQPTDVADAQDAAAIAAVVADNAARGVTLDDGASINFLSAANQGIALPWLTPANPARIGSVATLHQPVVLDWRNSAWKFQPQHRVTDNGADVVTFSDTRTPNEAPAAVGGNVKLGAMNVLNYFNTTGTDWVTSGRGTCTFFNDRTGDPVSDNSCLPNGPRGAAESTGGGDFTDPDADLERQRIKIVHAINTLDADVVSLEEVENSVALGEANRDDALASLVDALNADAGTTRWAYAPSPDAAHLPDLAEQDVIRTAFIYNPNTIDLVGDSVVLVGALPFANAREPLAQAFKRKDALTADAFLVVTNHFKSKGSGVDDGTGQGNANPDRIAQAQALVTFADQVAADRGTTRIFLTGDFNAYTMEDPIQVIEGAGYTDLTSPDPDDTSYQFGGMAGSLDHVFANADALDLVEGFDVWRINAEESVGFEYSRYNYNATLLWQNNQFRASDHNPEIAGLNIPRTTEASLTDSTVTPTSVVVRNGSVIISSTVSGGTHTPTGTVEYWLGADKLGESILESDGTTQFTYGPFQTVGSRTVEIRYLGDITHNGSTDTVTFDVTKAASATAVVVDPTSVVVGHGTTATATVTAPDGYVPTGSVEFWVGGAKVSTVPVNGSGVATADLGPFGTVGTKAVEARYLGDATTLASVGTTSVTVTKGESTVQATATPDTVEARAGKVTIDVTVESTGVAPTGTVNYLIGGVKVGSSQLKADGTTSIVLGPFSAAGTKTVEVSYVGDARTTGSSTTVDVEVTKVSSTTDATVAPASAVVTAGKVTVSASVATRFGSATGAVDFLVDGVVVASAPLVDGVATAQVGPFATVGTESIEARYAGTAAFAGSSDTVSIEVVKATPTMKITRTPSKVVVKKTKVTLSVALSAVGHPVTGTVRVLAGGKIYEAPLVSGVANLTLLPFQSVGSKSVVVTYLGDDLDESVSKTITIVVGH